MVRLQVHGPDWDWRSGSNVEGSEGFAICDVGALGAGCIVEMGREVFDALGGDGDGEAAYPWRMESVVESLIGASGDEAGGGAYFCGSGSPLLSSGMRGDFLRDGH